MQRRLAAGLLDRIGGKATAHFALEHGDKTTQAISAPDHAAAVRILLEWLESRSLTPRAVGHRVVHGGERFVEPTPIDDGVVADIEALAELAPLHNGPAVAALRAAREALGPAVPMVATFDTAFHRSMPARAARYAISGELAERYAVYRYGFHGLAHRSMMERCAEMTGKPAGELQLITLQLGAGCSATAIEHGRSIDTSMGFTPLEGLVMGTRSGDIDPSVVMYLANRDGIPPAEVLVWLNERSGLLGVSGRSADMRDLLEAERAGDEGAALAVEMFCYRARKYIGAYLAALGGADAVVFGGGIGEHAPEIRARICRPLEPLGLQIDAGLNAALVGQEGAFSAEDSFVAAYVVHVDEANIIARDTFALLSSKS